MSSKDSKNTNLYPPPSPFPREDERNQKRKSFGGKTSAIWLNMSKSSLHLLSLFREKLVTFCTIWAIFGRKRQAHKSKGRNQNLIYPFTPARFLVNFLQRSLIRAFSSFVAIGHKGHFRKMLTWIFKFGFFSWYHACIFEKNNLAFNVASISTNLYFLVFPF